MTYRVVNTSDSRTLNRISDALTSVLADHGLPADASSEIVRDFLTSIKADGFTLTRQRGATR